MKLSKKHLLSLTLLITGSIFAHGQSDTTAENIDLYRMQPIHMQTRWKVNPLIKSKEYPRPQLERNNWQNLNGLWEYAITDSATDFPNSYNGTILVPYPIESALSGVKKTLKPDERLWYKMDLEAPVLKKTDRLILNFGAVDWQATIFINKKNVAIHTNGYEGFSIDITDYLKSGINELLVKVYDPTDQGPNPHGKQTLNPGNIYYTPTSGIWQTVWLEKVPLAHIKKIKTSPDIDRNLLSVLINTCNAKANMFLEVSAISLGKVLSTQRVRITNDSNQTRINLPISNTRLWSPDTPFLYDLSVKLLSSNKVKVLDEIKSYFGMRKINIQKDEKGRDRIYLNNQYTFNFGVLDQGYWPEGLYTAPTDEALSFDIKAIKLMGFNTIRKHIKIEPERWYYYADKIGVLVWQDFVNPPHSLPNGSKEIFEKEIKETIEQLYNHPSIITWVVFNERWGAYDQQRITEWVKKYDSSRIINGHSGELLYVNNELREASINPWVSSDLTDVHAYPEPRNPPGLPGKAKVLGEFGGIGVAVPSHQWDDLQGWGYISSTADELKQKYEQMIFTLKRLEKEGLSGAIYTQPFDVEGEENGLLTYDREIIKIPLNNLRDINRTLIKGNIDTNPSFTIATNINSDDNDNRYEELLLQYKKGKLDSSFLRRLVLTALRKKDQLHATEVGNSYIDILTTPLSKENLLFINYITNTTDDRGFYLLSTNVDKVNAIFGKVYAQYKVKQVIEKSDFPGFIDKVTALNWDSLYQEMSHKYGQLGEELVLGKQMMYYHDTQDWKNYGKYYKLYFKKAYKHPDYKINNLTWLIFINVDDPIILEFATQVIKYDLETWDQYNPSAYDTYANLLHKLNKSSEGIIWEEKALKMKRTADEERVFAETLQKMKAGLPTWPQNN
ncbi:glycoside hydrolase family 2 protein [Chitinophaga polysaccharea]|uniref:glycoside hydrolase family 2 protein n=1 Tax=Chitinophaga polysaccharea TaxID=1293035 RepID=UPI001159E494|nr:sugar-binding domain-containing protein [Chitinophaga polysaccharea]